ncbi:hypothetical protein DVR12_17760 [Chitinophaga silvatica]|uniref:Uncharacterized protein n=1 Tax=Chitinophaga silvatica TaxID=2282649 RepID=A0A3E1Y7W6_9BACT|nr:hypothetical protein DVR12_17760 [Chitinophaga silvatica]
MGGAIDSVLIIALITTIIILGTIFISLKNRIKKNWVLALLLIILIPVVFYFVCNRIINIIGNL